VARSALDLNGSKTFQEIADEGGLSLKAVKRHLHSVYRTLEVKQPQPADGTDALILVN
jgi:DNA-binding NarL/FixJ family response regulator